MLARFSIVQTALAQMDAFDFTPVNNDSRRYRWVVGSLYGIG
jgi:hypothetical protein